ncbi:MAG: XTP/dITP diphosphatase [Candidatus Izemoplasma sp.]
MKEIVIATKNSHKIIEFKEMLEPMGYQVLSLFDFEEVPDIEETGTSFRENAMVKAKALSDYLNKTVIADDSGLEVFSLNKDPGIYSARYAGIEKDYNKNNELLLKNLEGITDRKARFVTAMCIYYIDQDPVIAVDFLYGEIIDEYRGDNGFGYDPIFYLKELDKTLAELPMNQKNELSHRGKCLKQIIKYL